MIEYLEKLKSEERWDELVRHAEQELKSRNNTAKDLMQIYSALLVARLYLKQYEAAIAAGNLASKLAAELELWDEYGAACVDLGVAHDRLKQRSEAMIAWSNYLERLPMYQRAREFEANVWYNLGTLYTTEGDSKAASDSLYLAMQAANRMGNARDAHGIRQALIGAYVRAGEYREVPGLLSRCQRYLRNHPDVDEGVTSLLWQYKLRATFLIVTKRYSKAKRCALVGLSRSEGMPVHQFHFHMLLANIALATDDTLAAMEHTLAAKTYSVVANRVDLEREALELQYTLTG